MTKLTKDSIITTTDGYDYLVKEITNVYELNGKFKISIDRIDGFGEEEIEKDDYHQLKEYMESKDEL